jgi:hypothetical protein
MKRTKKKRHTHKGENYNSHWALSSMEIEEKECKRV